MGAYLIMFDKTRQIIYGDAYFVPVCEICCRYVKADKTILVNEITGLHPQPNATCSKHGRIHMIFEGFV